jgi:hypothetical protein
VEHPESIRLSFPIRLANIPGAGFVTTDGDILMRPVLALRVHRSGVMLA